MKILIISRLLICRSVNTRVCRLTNFRQSFVGFQRKPKPLGNPLLSTKFSSNFRKVLPNFKKFYKTLENFSKFYRISKSFAEL